MAQKYSTPTTKRVNKDGQFSDHDSSFQQFVDPTNQTPSKEIKRELPSPLAVQVCPINVEQGDSILVKLKYNDGMYNPNLMISQ